MKQSEYLLNSCFITTESQKREWGNGEMRLCRCICLKYVIKPSQQHSYFTLMIRTVKVLKIAGWVKQSEDCSCLIKPRWIHNRVHRKQQSFCDKQNEDEQKMNGTYLYTWHLNTYAYSAIIVIIIRIMIIITLIITTFLYTIMFFIHILIVLFYFFCNFNM